MINNHGKSIKRNSFSLAFTIVELIIVIVVIGILATISIVVYPGARDKAIETSITTQLVGSASDLKSFRFNHDKFPATIDCSISDSDTNFCTKPGDNVTYTYRVDNGSNPQSFTLYAQSSINNKIYSISDSSDVVEVAELPISCPTGFILVPGSATYDTNDFCVMKYEAKADDNGDGIGDIPQTTNDNTWSANTYPISSSRKLVSSAAGYPVANITQTTAITAAANYTAHCTSGCHLITEAEWMTIAQNVLSVASNWSGGSVGSGYIYNGHVNNYPAVALEASTDDADSLYGITGDTGSGSSYNNKRTLVLTNGEVIWDIAGNVAEWTSSQITGNQPGYSTDSGYFFRQWNDDLLLMNGLPTVSQPSSIGLASVTWNSSAGIGKLLSNYNDTLTKNFHRGGDWNDASSAGVLALCLNLSSVSRNQYIGFRVVAS